MAFVNRKGPVDIVEMAALGLHRANEKAFSCVGHQCTGCELEVERHPGSGYTCALINAYELGVLEGTTRKQKEVLACIAIFGRYPIEEEK